MPRRWAIGAKICSVSRATSLLPFWRQGVERAHVVQPVGELDEDDAQVLRHGQQHAPEVLGLALAAAVELDLAQLRDAAHEEGDLLAELLADDLEVVPGVLDDIVEEGGGEGGVVEFEFGEEEGDGEGVGDVVVAGEALLAGGGPLPRRRRRAPSNSRLKCGL